MQLQNLGNIGQLALDFRALSAASQATNTAMDFSLVTNSLRSMSAEVIAAAASMAGLSAEQSATAIAAAGYSAAETAAALATQNYDAVTIAAAFATQGLSAEQIAGALASAGFSASQIAAALATTGLSEAEIVATLETTGLSTAEARAAATAAAMGAANAGAATATTRLASSLRLAASGMITFLATNPVGWAILAAGAIFGVAKAYEAFTESMEEAQEKAQESRQKFEQSQQEVDSIKTELEQVGAKIDEINAKDNLTISDQEQLDLLISQRTELENLLKIKQQIAESDAKQAADDARNVLEKKYGEDVWDEDALTYHNVQDNIIGHTLRKQRELNDMREEYNALLAKHAAEAEDDSVPKTHKWYENWTEYEADENRLQTLKDNIDYYEQDINDDLKTITDNYENLFVNGKPVEGFEDVAQEVGEAFGFINKSAEEAADGVADTAEQVVESYTSAVATIAENAQATVASINAITDAISSQSTGKSISLEDYNSEELKAYSSALEYHNGCLQYNTEKVREITKAKAEEEKATIAANKAQDQAQYLKNAKEIQSLREQLSSATDENRSSIEAQIDSLLSENAALADNCRQFDLMTASINEATGAYQNWLNAQSAAESGEMFDASLDAFQKIMDTLNNEESDSYGRIGNADYKAALEFVIPDSVDTNDEKAINSYLDSVRQYLTFDEDGNYDGLDIAQFCAKATEAGLMTLDESGENYVIAGQKTMEDFAEGLGLSLPLVQAMFGEMEEFGAVFDWGDEAGQTFGDLAMKANEAAESLRGMEEHSGLKLVLDVSEFENKETAIATLDENIRQMNELKAKPGVDASEIEQANSIIQYCVAQKQILNQPDVMTVDTSQVTGALGEALSMFQEFQSLKDTIAMQAAVGADTSQAEADLAALTSKISSSEACASIGLTVDEADAQGSISSFIAGLDAQAIISLGVDATLVSAYTQTDQQGTGTIVWDNNTSAVDSYAAQNQQGTGTVVWGNNTINVRTHFTATGTINWSGGHGLNGTAHVSGTAMVGGNWGTAQGGTTLVGELGREIVVDPRSGRWYTVGDNGAEFRDIPHNAIVFNHLQSESLLNNGYALGRATALASGTAMVTGGIRVSQANRSTQDNSGKPTTTSVRQTSHAAVVNRTSTTTNNSNSTSEDFEEQLDWVEVALTRIQEAIDRVKITAESAFKTLSQKNKAASKEIALLTDEIDLQKSAYKKYMQEANALGLSETYAEKVRDGSIEIETIKDENLRDKIKQYQDLYEKAVEAKDSVAELKEEIAQLYLDKFNNIVDDYDNQLSLIEHLTQTYEQGLDYLEEAGMMGSTSYYNYLIKAERESITIMEDELARLEDSFEEAMQSGRIKEYSDAWYEMRGAINETRENIDEATTSLLRYQNAMRQLEWDYFDFTQDRISKITEESDFLIDLLSGKDLFDENGKMTAEGTATMGLHGSNYNVYMAQADEYAEKVKELNEELANNPTDTNLLKQRDEYLKLQRESILNAENEKQAIVDLVENGYNAQIDAIKELIDAYTDSLDSAKDLYDYQKKVKEQTSEIATLQKQLSAFSNDTSEESKAKIQKIQVDLSNAMEELEETQYDQYITDQKKLLDELLIEYETVLNERLDNVDTLLSDCITAINNESGAICTALENNAESVGYSISDANEAIWKNDGLAYGVVSMYGENIKDQLTTIDAAINGIKAYTDTLLDKANAEAAAKKAQEEAAAKKAAEAAKKKTEAKKSQTNTNTSNSNKTRSDKDNYGVALAIWNGNYGWGVGKDRVNKLKAKGFDPNKVQSIVNQMGKDGYVYSGAWVGKYHGIKDLSPYAYNKFAHGTRYISAAQLAWTQENGSEMVMKPSQNALLTSLDPGDRVLKNKSTENLWDFATDPAAFMSSILSLPKIPNQVSNLPQSGVNMGDVNITIPIEHVSDYNDFVSQLRNDPKFQKMVQSMTIGIATGGSELSKYKYSWK